MGLILDTGNAIHYIISRNAEIILSILLYFHTFLKAVSALFHVSEV